MMRLKRFRARLHEFFDSLVFRIGVVLAIGIVIASLTAVCIVMSVRMYDFLALRNAQVVASTMDIAQRLARDPANTSELLGTDRIFGARAAPDDWPPMRPEPELSEMLRARMGPASRAEAMAVPHDLCFPSFDLKLKAAGISNTALPDCWYVRFRDAHGQTHRLAIDLVSLARPHGPVLDPLYVTLILVASITLAIIVASFVARPLRRLTEAARTFSLSVEPDTMPEQGPREVKIALATFNLMQQRIRAGFAERTHILAAIAHDLQTPLTRMRLRLEQIGEENLRDRLICDLSVMQRLVRDGLDLARCSENAEPWSVVDVDSIVSSIAEDAAEFGADVQFVSGCRGKVRVKPGALARCLANLVDNAVKYAGGADLACRIAGGVLTIAVRDRGAGIPEALLEDVFKPFHREGNILAAKPQGTGLGLTIARAQARAMGGDLVLANRSGGGLEATVRLPLTAST